MEYEYVWISSDQCAAARRSGILLYFFLKKLFGMMFVLRIGNAAMASLSAFIIAFLWIVHPVHSAAVDYISGRADSLAFLFACGGGAFPLGAGSQSS